ncbi:MAG: hypothetical protein ACOZNI_21495 [Myxococcota bacterium]
MRAALILADLDAFYTQHADVGGLAVEASASVSPFALAEAAWLARKVLGPADRRALGEAGVRLVIVGTGEMVTDLPEYAHLTPKVWWDRRYRGMGPTADLPVVLCSEEDLLDLPGDDVPGDSACLHELAHALQFAREARDPGFVARLDAVYAEAMTAGLWRDTYSATHPAEYLAVGAVAWFDALTPAVSAHTRDALRAYDPGLATLCEAVFGDGGWRYSSPTSRGGRAHLARFDPARLSPFTWPERARWDTPELRLPWVSPAPAVSASGDAASWVVFENLRHRSVEIVRLDGEGVRHEEHTLPSGGAWLASTTAGEVWTFREGSRELGTVVARESLGYASIGASPPGPLDPDALARAPRLPLQASPPAVSPIDGEDAVWVVFANRRDHAVEVDWLDFDGVRHPYHLLQPGEELVRDAYVGHVWWLRAGETDLGAVVIGATAGRVEIE